MHSDKYINFFYEVGKSKPNNMIKNEIKCPFCDKDNLDNIIDEYNDIILLKNKYPTLENSLQLVIIESSKCNSNLSLYSKKHVRSLFKFSINHWLKLRNTNDFKSVILYKNHGPLSGGSLKHPHMQIIGLKDINYEDILKDIYFQGNLIYKKNSCEVNISTHPLNCFTEFNVIIENKKDINFLADNTQKIVHYILNNYRSNCDSFNLFFYYWRNKIICKITPRFVTSPLLLGYSLKQVPNNNNDIINSLKELYFK